MVDLLRRGCSRLPTVLLVPVILLNTACASTATPRGENGIGEASVPPPADSAVADSATAPSPARIASDRLVDRAVETRRGGELEVAESLLGRAIRVDPSNGRAYLELAVVRSDQDLREEALGLVERALDLLPSEGALRMRAERLRTRLGGG